SHLRRHRRRRQGGHAVGRPHGVQDLERRSLRRTTGDPEPHASRPDALVRRAARPREAVHEGAARQPRRRPRDAQQGVAQLHAVRDQGDAARRRSGEVTAMRTRGQAGPIAMRIRPIPFFLLAGLLLPAVAVAQAPDLTGTTLVSMKGTLAPDEKTADDVGWGGISLGFTGDNAGKTRWFGVVHATAVGGGTLDTQTAGV